MWHGVKVGREAPAVVRLEAQIGARVSERCAQVDLWPTLELRLSGVCAKVDLRQLLLTSPRRS